MELFTNLPVFVQAGILTFFTWLLTGVGASIVLFIKTVSKYTMAILLSLSAGVMLASAIFSLLLPSIEQSEKLFSNKALMPTLGLLIGGVFVILSDVLLDKIMSKKSLQNINKNSLLMFSAITMHNIPEGMCIGVAVASANLGIDGGIMTAIVLALGIGIQNIPEGSSVAFPLYSNGFSKFKAFMYGQFSGMVEFIFGILASLFATLVFGILPFLLSFSAGAMISVACTELIPEATKINKNLTTFSIIIGFLIMMILDLVL